MCYGLNFAEVSAKSDLHHFFTVAGRCTTTSLAENLAGGAADDAVETPAEIEITQGSHIGRPSRLSVRIPETGGIVVTGTATPIA